jgi:CheY-like chemotaxis protein
MRMKKDVAVHRILKQDLRTVEVDQGQMEQVFMNLFVNAGQAMPDGGDLTVATENCLLSREEAAPFDIAAGEYVKLSVADTGTGMDENTLQRIFDPFFTTKPKGRGTGLGLAMVYGIIKGHGGRIDVASEPGRGSTFDIYLPASGKAVATEEPVERAIVMGTETILLVDDEEGVLEVSKELLTILGYRLYVAGSGQAAIAIYMEKQHEIDLVILDMIMPGISGGETFDRLRAINRKVRVLLSSGYSEDGHAREILDRGCNGFIQKPFAFQSLSQKVREILDN